MKLHSSILLAFLASYYGSPTILKALRQLGNSQLTPLLE